MLTKRALNKLLIDFVADLKSIGVSPDKMFLFGSYAKGNVHAYSDVDVASWSKKFSGESLSDFDMVKPILKKYPKLQAKLYPSFADEHNYDPFIYQIKQTGIAIV